MDPTISARGLTKRFGAVTALDSLDLTAQPGRITALLGPNGSGKTTFVRTVATLVPPDVGHLEVAGIDVGRRPAEVRRQIGLAGQTAAVEELMTVRENLRLVARLFGHDRASARRAADQVLELLDLADAADRLVRTYSGGMRRRLDLGASLVGAPRLLLLDEPTTGLDPRSRNELWQVVRDLLAVGTDVLLTTQYLDEADQLAHEIVIIDHGRVIASGTPEQLKTEAGRDVIEVRVRDVDQIGTVADALEALGAGRPHSDLATRRLTLPVDDGTARLRETVRTIDERGIEVDDVGLRRPSLDEVFLFRYVFGGAIDLDAGVDYVNFLVPGFVVTGVLFSGTAAAAGVAADVEAGFVDRLRSLPVSRGGILAGRAVADMAMVTWGLFTATVVGVLVGFRFESGPSQILLALGLCVVFGFAFACVFIMIGLFAGSAQAAQGMSLMVFPLAFVSSAYVPVDTMPGWMQPVAEHQPLTMMIGAVRSLVLDESAVLLGHDTGYYLTRSMMWSVVLVAVFLPLVAVRYRRA